MAEQGIVEIIQLYVGRGLRTEPFGETDEKLELSVDLQGGHLGLHAVPHLPRRPGGHVRPEGEVAHRRGAERAEIPSQQLGSGLVEWDLR